MNDLNENNEVIKAEEIEENKKIENTEESIKNGEKPIKKIEKLIKHNKKILITTLILIITAIFSLNILLSLNSKSKKAEISIYANMAVLLEAGILYSTGREDVLYYSNIHTKLMNELDNINVPHIPSLEIAITNYKIRSYSYMIKLLEAHQKTKYIATYTEEEFKDYINSITILKNELQSLDEKYEFGLNISSPEVREAVKNLKQKINY